MMISPFRIKNLGKEVWVLDRYSIYSVYIKGNFETVRTNLGELVYQVKYNGRRQFLDKLIKISVNFLKERTFIQEIDLIVPVPPVINRVCNLVLEISIGIGNILNIPVKQALTKVKETPRSNEIETETIEEKTRIIFDSLKSDPLYLKGKNVLLIDDIIDSGATFRASVYNLLIQGKAKDIYGLILTATKK